MNALAVLLARINRMHLNMFKRGRKYVENLIKRNVYHMVRSNVQGEE